MPEAKFLSTANNVINSQSQDSLEYLKFCDFLEKISGITLGKNKAYLVTNRLRSILEAHGIDTLSEAMNLIESGHSPKIKLDIVDAMTTNETSWFRDQYPFEYLHDVLLPKLVDQRMHTPRIWSAACSYGHEAYSISIIIEEYMMKNPGCFPNGIQIVGTDLSSKVLKSASTGEFDRLAIARGLSEERKRKYFTQLPNEHYKLDQKIKSRVRFQSLNLLDSYLTLGKFDIIFCRNVLIYFSNENKAAIMNKFSQSLLKEGVLILGASETVSNYSNAFNMVSCPRGVVYSHH